MVNRIRKLIASEQMNPSQFADEIKLQRSSLSHVLSGRNKPSLDFVMKIKHRFTEVNLEWLLFGEGNMLLGEQKNIVNQPDNQYSEGVIDDMGQLISLDSESQAEYSGKSVKYEKQTQSMKDFDLTTTSGPAERVIIFFSNGTFMEYAKSKK